MAEVIRPINSSPSESDRGFQSITIRSTSAKLLRTLRRFSIYFIVIAGSLMFAIPFFWMVRWSLMSQAQFYDPATGLIPNPPNWENYAQVWRTGPLLWWIVNSTIITFIAVTLGTLVSALVAYGFARVEFPGRRGLFILVLATMMVPLHVTIIPLVIIFRELEWLDTLLPLVIPGLGGGAFYIFILRQFFRTIPIELDEAARTDGANRIGIFFRVILPLSKPALATVAVLSFIGSWNDFFFPLIVLNSSERLTLAVGMRWFSAGQYASSMHQLQMAISCIAVLPIVVAFFFAQRHFIRGITLTGIKG